MILRIVTKGDNIEAVKRTIKECEKFGYPVEVVTDTKLDLSVNQIVVPKDYKPKKGAKWKARALHYASQYATNPNWWYLHLDEESIPTIDCIWGCEDFILKYPKGAIGQGEILYNGHNYKPYKRTCSADNLRTGDDCLRFKLQYTIGKPLFGVHGSFLLIKGNIEKKIGWDLGASGSVTEDASFAIKAWQNGVQFGWVDGQVIEQSPYTFMDFIKQRRRWFNGLWVVATCPDFKLRYRSILGLMMIYWTLSPIVLTLNIFILFGLVMPIWLKVFFTINFVYYLSAYSIGGWRNNKLKGLLFSIIMLPISFIYETIGVLYGIFKPVKTFEVVNKN